MVNFEEQIKLIVELQGLDTQIFRLEDSLESIPQEIKKMEDAYSEKMNNLKKLEDEIKALQLKRKDKEGELGVKEGSIKKLQTQLYQVKTNKEYTALQNEISRIKADNSILEENVIKILDQIDIENQKVAKEKEFLKSEEGKLAEEKKRMDEEIRRIKGELENLKKQRAELAAKVDKVMMDKYDRLIKGKDGLAIVPVSNYACQGCFRILPPQVINEIRMNQELVFCEHCARILYIEE